MATVAQHVMTALTVKGIQRVYGVAGDGLNGFTDAIRRSDTITWELFPPIQRLLRTRHRRRDCACISEIA
jgi:hypothetical protein